MLSENEINEHLLDISIWEDNIKDLNEELSNGSSPSVQKKIRHQIIELKLKIDEVKLLLKADEKSKNVKGIKLSSNQIEELSKFKLKYTIGSMVVSFPKPVKYRRVELFFSGYKIVVLHGDKEYVSVIRLAK